MKALGLAFSARREGNCLRLTGYCLEEFARWGFETYDFANLDFPPEALLFSAREYRNSLDGDLIEVPEVKERLEGFVERILKKVEER